MYREFYGFSEEPFSVRPDPKFLYLSLSHFETLSSMVTGIQQRKGILVVTGEAGIGKTILIYALLKDLTEKIRTAFVLQTRVDFKNLLKNILRDLEVPFKEEVDNTPSLIVEFRKYLEERLTKDETVTIVIDEAQSLDEEVLESLFRLTNSDSPASKLLQILLVGHKELEGKLNAENLRPLRSKVGVRCRIRPLTRAEGREYIKHRLKLVGRDICEVFAPVAIDQIWQFAEGIPRIMNLVCDRAFIIGCNASRPKIDSKIISEAIKDIGYLRPSKSKTLSPELSQKKPSATIFRILFFLFSLGASIFFLSQILNLILRK
jgi:general secretion pathway protein A